VTRRLAILALSLALPALAAAEPAVPAAAAAAATPQAQSDAARQVARLQEALLGIMKDAKALGYEGRYQRLQPVVQQVFDLPFMAEKSVGRHWAGAGEQNQQALVATFGRFTVANFAGRFDGWSGQSFRIDGEEPSTHGTVLVRTHLDSPEGEGVELNYRLRDVGGTWRIVDIYLNGTVSELALRRSEYSALVQREGFKALLAKLDERIADLARPPAGTKTTGEPNGKKG
jgi:phospholipid transport system substrate-binding protein